MLGLRNKRSRAVGWLAGSWLCLLTIAAASPPEITRQARIYEMGKSEGPPVYTQTSRYTSLPGGRTRAVTVIRDPERAVVVSETAVYQGSRIESQSYSDFQSNQQHELDVRGRRALFSTRSLLGPGPAQEDEKTIGPDFLSGPAIEPFLREHWEELMQGKGVRCQLVALPRHDTYGFEFSVRGTGETDGRPAVMIDLKPTGALTSMAVHPIHLIVDLRERRFLRWIGRTPLQIERGGDSEPLDAEVVFE